MCGIVGLWDLSTSSRDLDTRVRSMAACLAHRGPDGDGLWVDAEAGIALGHRRLAVVDLTDTGAQPMVSSCGRFVLTYNGELYDLGGLRAELIALGRTPRGTSDTAVLLEACAQWGVARALERCVGMFAFALWDRRDRRLTLARDRLGIKPLVWTRASDTVAFASDLTSLRRVGLARDIDRDALAAYLDLGHVAAPLTIHPGVSKVAPGTLVTIEEDGRTRTETFWSLDEVIAEVREPGRTATRTDTEMVDGLEAVLAEAVRVRMLADVPLGAFLSGGIDSSTVVALMQRASSRPVRTFSIGSPDPARDEGRHALAVARHLGTEHTAIEVGPDEALATLPEVMRIADEPFADSSLLPTLLVSRLARAHVTVALSGDGGDELFAGYTRHLVADGPLASAMRLPAPLRRAIASTVTALPPRLLQRAGRVVPARVRARLGGESIGRFAQVVGTSDGVDAHHALVRAWSDAAALVPGARTPDVRRVPAGLDGLVTSATDRMRYLDTLGYLPDDILTKVDRASMAVSLEARVPILDHRVVAYAWGLPPHALVRDGTTKWVLRQVLARHVPPALTERPKRGFSVPIGAWLAGPLRDWAEGLLTVEALARDDLLDPAPIRARWAEHLAGGRDHGGALWTVLALQAWREGLAA